MENIKLIVDVISGKKKINDYKNIKINISFKDEHSTCYEVLINDQNYILYYPPLILSYPNNSQNILIYTGEHLSTTLDFLAKKNYYIKINDKNDTVYSIKDSKNFIFKTLNFGLKYELIEKKENKNEEACSYTEFLSKLNIGDNFTQKCKYYKLYCKNNDSNTFRYVKSKERYSFIRRISGFFFNDEKVMYYTGQRGIGKTTSILYFLYNSNNPFFYLNL